MWLIASKRTSQSGSIREALAGYWQIRVASSFVAAKGLWGCSGPNVRVRRLLPTPLLSHAEKRIQLYCLTV